MYTSYFAKSGKHPKAVCVARFAPPTYRGKFYTRLAPSEHLLAQFKSGRISEEEYTIEFKKILDKIDARAVVKALGEDAVLLCWEGKDKFCHRHLVAKWITEQTGVDVEELE